jgi:hypothetical protein
MIADLNVHWDMGADGMPKPYTHVMLTMRSVDADGFGPKMRDWNRTEMVERWRERWADRVNERLAELDIDALIDRGQITVYARSLRRLRVFGSWSECLTYACRVARDRRDLAARQSQTAAGPA